MRGQTAPMRSLLVPALVAALALAACGGGEDGETTVAASDTAGMGPFVTLPEAEAALDRELAIVRVGLPAAPSAERVEQPTLASARYAAQMGGQFDVLVFPTKEAAQVAGERLAEQGEEPRRAVNVLLVFDEPPASGTAQARARRAFARLAQACAGQPIEGLVELCDRGDDAPEPNPPGAGADPDEAREPGAPILVDGIRYRVTLARKLNRSIPSDRAVLDGARPGEGRAWLGVFVRACNVTARRKPMARTAVVVASSGTQVARRGLDTTGSYGPRRLWPGQCSPQAERPLPAGGLMAFPIPTGFVNETPIVLRITGDDGGQGTVLLDL